MSLDGVFLNKVKNELLEQALNSRIDKIHQPSREELVLLMRSKGLNKKIVISVKNSAQRINFTDNSYENPMQPPMFCMLLRKHLSGAKLVDIKQCGFERILTFEFNANNEMGDVVHPKLVVEFIGVQSNIILVDTNGHIIDAVKRSDIESSARMIQPGARYNLPVSQNKALITSVNIEELAEKVLSNVGELSAAIVNVVDGISPLVAREVSKLVTGSCQKQIGDLTVNETESFPVVLEELKTIIQNGKECFMLINSKGIPFEFSYLPIMQYGSGADTKQFDSYSKMLDSFYYEREQKQRIAALSSDLFKMMTTVLSRTRRKIESRKQDLKKCENREQLRIYGELIKANLHNLKRGTTFAEVENYYDKEMAIIRIPLNNAISPADNAQKYFKEYKKTYTAEQMLISLIEDSENELKYVESVLDSLNRAESVVELEAVRAELTETGYLKRSKSKAKKAVKQFTPRNFVSQSGYNIYVGRNNKQNDELTLKIASKTDIWLHIKNYPGSHVIIQCNGSVPDDQTIVFAAGLAAYYSKAGESSSVPVDYCQVKYVKKPSGARPGMVIYTDNKTMFVNPTQIKL